MTAAPCTTRSQYLPGGIGLDDAAEQLKSMPHLSAECVTRLIGIYGSRATELFESPGDSVVWMDSQKTVLAAEVAFVMREEMAVNLTDILHRRMMIGLSPDQGLSLADEIASIAAVEAGWSEVERNRQLLELRNYSAKFRV